MLGFHFVKYVRLYGTAPRAPQTATYNPRITKTENMTAVRWQKQQQG